MNTKSRKTLFLTMLLAVLSIHSIAFADIVATTDPYIDQIISWNDTSPMNSGDLNIVLGPSDDLNGFTISSEDELILAFTDNIAFDGPGDDIYLYENSDASEPESVDVWASYDNQSYIYLGNAQNDAGYDLSNYSDLDFVQYIMLVGTSTGGADPGYDLLAVEALNSLPLPVPGAALLLGTGLTAFWGLTRKRIY